MYLLIDNYQVPWKRLISLWNQESLVPRISFHGHQTKECKLIKLWKQPSVSLLLLKSAHRSPFHFPFDLTTGWQWEVFVLSKNFIETHEHQTGPHEAGDQDENSENCWNKKALRAAELLITHCGNCEQTQSPDFTLPSSFFFNQSSCAEIILNFKSTSMYSEPQWNTNTEILTSIHSSFH